MIIVACGLGPVFLSNAVLVAGVFVVLSRRCPKSRGATRGAESLGSAMRAGVRYVRETSALRTVVVGMMVLFGLASALWALLPLVVKVSLGRGRGSYGALVGCLGLGGLVGAALPPAWRKGRTDKITAVASAGFAIGLLALAWVSNFAVLVGTMVIAGAGWLTMVSSFNLATLSGAATAVQGRALSISTLTLFGSLAVGALLWGVVANQSSIEWALTAAGGGMLLGLSLIPWFRLESG